MSPIAVLSTSGQLMVALDVMRVGPSDERYRWALDFLRINSANALAAIRDPRERTRLATEARKALGGAHRSRAVELRRTLTTSRTAEIMAEEDHHPETPYDESTIRRWVREFRASESST